MKRLDRIAMFAAFSLAAAGTAMAETCAMNYEQFEVGVPHTDLEDCPASMAQDGLYCRLTLVAETVTVFAFAEANNCLVTIKVFEDEAFTLKVD